MFRNILRQSVNWRNIYTHHAQALLRSTKAALKH